MRVDHRGLGSGADCCKPDLYQGCLGNLADVGFGVFLGLGGGDVVQDFILGVGLGRWMTFAIMMLICFVLGMFIDWIGIVMITFPIFLPIAKQLGFDPIWFVVTMAVMLQDSFLTPPFGYALFYLKGSRPS